MRQSAQTVVHGICAILATVLGLSLDVVRVPIYGFDTGNRTLSAGVSVVSLGTLNPALAAGVASLGAAIHHMLLARDPSINEGRARWAEYTVTAPIMMAAIAALCGVQMIGELIGVAAAQALCIVLRRQKMAAWLFLLIAWLLPTLRLAISDAPTIAFVVYAVMFLLFFLFGVIDNVSWLRSEPAAYDVASLCSKLSLVAMVCAGTVPTAAAVMGSFGLLFAIVALATIGGAWTCCL